MSRPSLELGLSADAFDDYYWLKAELAAFCRTHGLPVGGAKTDLVERIVAFLRDGTALPARPAERRRPTPLPDALSLATPIGHGWRCGQRLRAFFESEVGPSFRFNQALVSFVRDGEGRTLREALAAWCEAAESGPQPLAAQFEYNRHTREHQAARPEATPGEAREAWWEKRRRPRSEW